MSINETNPAGAQPVKVVESMTATGANNAAVAGSVTLATIYGAALPANVGAVLIINLGAGVAYVNPVGTAAANHFPVPANGSIPLYGNKTTLDLARVFAGGATIGVMVYEVQ